MMTELNPCNGLIITLMNHLLSKINFVVWQGQVAIESYLKECMKLIILLHIYLTKDLSVMVLVFFAKLKPLFSLPPGRGGFYIHPDGHSLGNWWLNNGTAGCLGLQENSSGLIRFSDMLKKYLYRNSFIRVNAY